MKNFIIGVLCLTLIWFGASLIRVENQRYALELEMCGTRSPENSLKRSQCLEEVETRTGPVAHLLYALDIL